MPLPGNCEKSIVSVDHAVAVTVGLIVASAILGLLIEVVVSVKYIDTSGCAPAMSNLRPAREEKLPSSLGEKAEYAPLVILIDEVPSAKSVAA